MTEYAIPQIPVEPIIARAIRGDEEAIQQAIDLEIDYQGRFVGFSLAEAIWGRVQSTINQSSASISD